MKRMIINGDDFGVSRQVNKAIVRACTEGILTSCSLMVTGDACAEAVRLAREVPRLAVGLHLVTVMGRSALPSSRIPHLVDTEGQFPEDPATAGLKYYFSTAARRELARELEAQFERFAATGLSCSHIDSHLHLHVHPVIFAAAARLGERFGVKRMRVPDDDLGLALRFDRSRPVAKSVYTLVFRLLARAMRRKLEAGGFVFTDRVYGNIHTGSMSEGYVLFVLRHLEEPTSEIYFHPAVHDGGSLSLDSRRSQCEKEFQILMSPKVKAAIQDAGIELTSYFGLDASPEAVRAPAPDITNRGVNR